MRTETEKSIIKQLLQDPKWRIVEDIAKELIENIKDQSNIGTTEWETARNAVLEAGQIQGINKLIQELYREAQTPKT